MIASCWVNRLYISEMHISLASLFFFFSRQNSRYEAEIKPAMQESLYLKSEQFGHMGRETPS